MSRSDWRYSSLRKLFHQSGLELTVGNFLEIEGFSTCIAMMPEGTETPECIDRFFDGSIPDGLLRESVKLVISLVHDIRTQLIDESFELSCQSSMVSRSEYVDWVEGFVTGVRLNQWFWKVFWTSPSSLPVIYPILVWSYDSEGNSVIDADQQTLSRVQNELMGDLTNSIHELFKCVELRRDFPTLS